MVKRILIKPNAFLSVVNKDDMELNFSHPGHSNLLSISRNENSFILLRYLGISLFVKKVQLLKNLKWLTLDLEINPDIARIVICLDEINISDLKAQLDKLFENRKIYYYVKS